MDKTAAGKIISFESSPNETLKIGGVQMPLGTKITLSNQKVFSEAVPLGPSTRFGKFDYFSVDMFLNYSNWKIGIEGSYIPDSANEALVYKFIRSLNLVYKNPAPTPIINKKANTLGILFVWIRSLEFPNQDLIWELPFKMECSSFVT